MDQLYDTLKVGTVLRVGHPANGVAWIKTEKGWITNYGGDFLSREQTYDVLEHGAFQLLIGGK